MSAVDLYFSANAKFVVVVDNPLLAAGCRCRSPEDTSINNNPTTQNATVVTATYNVVVRRRVADGPEVRHAAERRERSRVRCGAVPTCIVRSKCGAREEQLRK